MELIDPVAESDNEDDDIFEPEISFSGVFNIFVNQWYAKKVFNVPFRFHNFFEISEMLETHEHKNTAKLKCRKL